MRIVLRAVPAGVVAFLVSTGQALAAADGEHAGQKLGAILSGWAHGLYLGLSGLAVLFVMLSGRLDKIFAVFGMVIVAGAVVYAGVDLGHAAQSIVRAIT